MRRRLVLLTIGVLLSLTILCSWAEANVAVFDYPSYGATRAISFSEGWQFTPTNLPINVTHLGMWDDFFASWISDRSPGFYYETPIGIWRVSDQVLLTSTTLGPGTGDPLLGEFRYAEITPILLSPGETYAIAFKWPDSFYSGEWVKDWEPGLVNVDPAINIGPRVSSRFWGVSASAWSPGCADVVYCKIFLHFLHLYTETHLIRCYYAIRGHIREHDL